jgi:hypothetical protein
LIDSAFDSFRYRPQQVRIPKYLSLSVCFAVQLNDGSTLYSEPLDLYYVAKVGPRDRSGPSHLTLLVDRDFFIDPSGSGAGSRVVGPLARSLAGVGTHTGNEASADKV